MKEHDVIGHLRAAFETWGLGDDAAVLEPSDGDLLAASDAVVEGVHFRREYTTLGQAVQKVVTSNVSDIYAMGGVPHSILLTAGLPGGFSKVDLNGIVEGLELACRAYGIRLVGGDTVRNPGGCFFDVSIIGTVARGRAVPRSGARPGDAIVLYGECGGSLAGMLMLRRLHGMDEEAARYRDAAVGENGIAGVGAARVQRQLDSIGAKLFLELAPPNRVDFAAVRSAVPELTLSMEPQDVDYLCARHGVGKEATSVVSLAKQHLVPLARPLEPDVLASKAAPISAMIDVSDGLSKDLGALCAESGVGAVVEESLIPVPETLAGASLAHDDLTRLVLSSGEEYVLLGAVRGPGVGVEPPAGRIIGRIVDRAEGITLLTREGTRKPWPDLGYEHAF